jgi:cytochrome P450
MSMSETMAAPALIGPVPPKKPLSFLKFLREARDNVINTIPLFAYEQPISEMKVGLTKVLIVSDPAGVKHVLLDNVANYPKAPEEFQGLSAAFGEGLLTTDGEKWRRHRRIMAPSFDFKSIVSYAPAMVETTDRYLEGWARFGNGSTIDIADEMTKLTLKIISRTMFSTDSEELSELTGDTLHRGVEGMEFGLVDAIPLIGRWTISRKFDRIRRIFRELDTGMYRLIAEREKKPAAGPMDLLDRLIAARDADTGLKLTNEEVRDEVVIIFLAGHETTALAMTFVWYLLSQHPDVEARLHREIDSVLEGRLPTYDDLDKLPYVRMVIEESMRLYPPAPGLSNRVPLADDVICGRRVAKGTPVIVLPWVLHRHRLLWNDPDRFDPERFAPDREHGRHRFAYMPFGGGPRVCIGASLAMTEASLILATVAQRYRMRLVPGQAIKLLHRITLRPRDGIKMILEPRS